MGGSSLNIYDNPIQLESTHHGPASPTLHSAEFSTRPELRSSFLDASCPSRNARIYLEIQSLNNTRGESRRGVDDATFISWETDLLQSSLISSELHTSTIPTINAAQTFVIACLTDHAFGVRFTGDIAGTMSRRWAQGVSTTLVGAAALYSVSSIFALFWGEQSLQ